jgi:hypothetical protein
VLALCAAVLSIPVACAKRDAARAGKLPSPKILGQTGRSPGQFTFPRCLESDGSSLWVIDKSAHVQRLDPETGRATAFWTMPDFANGKPCGLTIAAPPPPDASWLAPGEQPRTPGDKLLYIADTHYFRVMVYAPPATMPAGAEAAPPLVGSWGTYGTGPGQFIYTTHVGVLTDERGYASRYYVSEYGDHDRVSVFDARTLAFLFSIGGPGSSADPATIQFSRPQSVALDRGRGRMVVTDACNHRVGVFSLDGALTKWIGGPDRAGNGVDQFAYPYGLLLLADGTAIVSEIGNARIKHIDLESGRTIACLGIAGRDAGELNTPWSVAMLGDRLWVLDSGNDRVQGFPARDFGLGAKLAALAGESAP